MMASILELNRDGDGKHVLMLFFQQIEAHNYEVLQLPCVATASSLSYALSLTSYGAKPPSSGIAASASRTSYLIRYSSCVSGQSRSPSPAFDYDRVLVQEVHPYCYFEWGLDLLQKGTNRSVRYPESRRVYEHTIFPHKSRTESMSLVLLAIEYTVHSLVEFADRILLKR